MVWPLLVAASSVVTFTHQGRYVAVEALDDDLVRFEAGTGTVAGTKPLYATPMVAKRDYPGPRRLDVDGRRIETSELRIVVAENLCVTVTDLVRGVELHRLCPERLGEVWKGFTLSSPATKNVYGLGQYFAEESADGDWIGRVWDPLFDGYGARLRGFAGGANNYSMFPIMYALGEGEQTYGLFVDSLYKQMWDFRASPWKVGMWGDQVRWYVLSGEDLPDVRRDYMELTGRPPVPPKRSFGLWVSEFGFTSFDEVDRELAHLRAETFPVDGFALDLQWFGGTFGDPDNSRMGSLRWDEAAFPNAPAKVRGYAEQHGVSLMLIEEPYISSTLEEHRELGNRGHLVRDCAGCPPTYLNFNPWWGRGGMVDYTSAAAGDFWHDYRRKALVDVGIHDHWGDLGEPEQYHAHAWYAGFPELGKHAHVDVHNVYGFRWMESIARGYERHAETARPFLLSRTGTSGIQRHGAAVWSGDIGTNWGNLRAQMNVQMHMSLSGVDYYGSDAGGFQRAGNNVAGGAERLYTQWFASSAALDVPLRPHAWNLDKQRPTSPARCGDKTANREALRLRYSLAPYYYSLAHQASRTGDPVVPPLVHHFQADPAVREIGYEKTIGKDLLVAVAADPDATSLDVYLPAGDWIDFHTGEWHASTGRTLADYPLFTPGYFRLPFFARAGAIMPMAKVDDQTMNVRGKRADGSRGDEARYRVFAGRGRSSFLHYEDDGETTAYKRGQVATTLVAQNGADDRVEVVIGATSGDYAGLADERPYVVDLYVKNAEATKVTLDGVAVPFSHLTRGVVRVDLGVRPARAEKRLVFELAPAAGRPAWAQIVCRNGETSPGMSVFAVGNLPQLGGWDPAKALRLGASAYPIWTGRVDALPAGTVIEWKCIKRANDGGAPTWQGGANNVLKVSGAGYVGESVGGF